ncbi:hypothetical protein IWX49DRAFT_621525 [Phyllosticta citricarpa]
MKGRLHGAPFHLDRDESQPVTGASAVPNSSMLFGCGASDPGKRQVAFLVTSGPRRLSVPPGAERALPCPVLVPPDSPSTSTSITDAALRSVIARAIRIICCLTENDTVSHCANMKSDYYLNLCLQQAALSPMHFRHGCIVVRGGKIIGQGFNDYRPGFDGGALKTGRLASASLDGPAIANLKRKSKRKEKKKSAKSFIPFETVSGMGGGYHANTPMSMHSEMMAIHSALSSSSTLAASTVSHQKPCFKLSGPSKRKSRLRQGAVKGYVERVCKDLLAVQQEQHQRQQQEGTGQAQADEWPSKGAANRTKNENQNQNENHVHAQKPARPYQPAAKQHHTAAPWTTNARKPKAKRQRLFDDESAKNHYILLPKGQSVHDSHSPKDRKKHPKLVGADLYVARLGHSGEGISKRSRESSSRQDNHPDEKVIPTKSSEQSSTAVTTGSLHDELTMLKKAAPDLARRGDSADDLSHPNCTIRASRPCYRCLSFMHNVGIKRVFWTNEEGSWEGAKVRCLIDELEGENFGAIGEAGGMEGGGVYVTKHEVLMLRRLMGGS